MAEDLVIPVAASKKEKYEALIPQIKGLLHGETNLIANMANVAGALKEGFDFFWVGFYLVDSPDQLVLGPFQGPVACTRIKKGKGVCGATWEKGETIIVPNVDEFPGHIACASASKSEIVLPVYQNEEIIAVLDIDSDRLDEFDEEDQRFLEEVLQLFR
ncbi:MAG: GAF domain-containing protein [Bacteroidota bacterium]